MAAWYDQPVADRVKAYRFHASQRRASAIVNRQDFMIHKDDEHLRRATANERQAVELDALADNMERTGLVLA